MPWKTLGEDRKVAIVVDPDFCVDLVEMARHRPIWIVDSPKNRPRIDAAWRVGKEEPLYQVNRCPVDDPEDRFANLRPLLEVLADHYHQEYNGVVVYGLPPSDAVVQKMKDWGFNAVEPSEGGFLALGRYNDDLVWGIGDDYAGDL
jgi:hypothetical protein